MCGEEVGWGCGRPRLAALFALAGGGAPRVIFFWDGKILLKGSHSNF